MDKHVNPEYTREFLREYALILPGAAEISRHKGVDGPFLSMTRSRLHALCQSHSALFGHELIRAATRRPNQSLALAAPAEAIFWQDKKPNTLPPNGLRGKEFSS